MKLKQWQNIFHVIVDVVSIVQHVIETKKGIIKQALKSVTNTSLTKCYEIALVIDVSTKMTNTIAANVMSTASTNYHSKNVRNCYILDTVFIGIILLLINYYYSYQKRYNIKMENNEFKIVRIKNRTCYYFDDIIK